MTAVRCVGCLACAVITSIGVGAARADVAIDFDPMRPPAAAVPAAAASDAAPSATPGLPTLRITRFVGAGAAGPATLSALVDDAWVRRGDIVAGYRVTALRNESIDLVSVAEPVQRLTLHLNPATVERGVRPAAPLAWPAPAMERTP